VLAHGEEEGVGGDRRLLKVTACWTARCDFSGLRDGDC
jgi:hypothetical protein